MLIEGGHYRCEVEAPHDGLAHANSEAKAVWDGAYDLDPSFANREMRVGRTIGRSLYLLEPGEDRKRDRCVGLVDTPGLAEIIAMRWNWVVEHGYEEGPG